jgi:hypothetical protein
MQRSGGPPEVPQLCKCLKRPEKLDFHIDNYRLSDTLLQSIGRQRVAAACFPPLDGSPSAGQGEEERSSK